MRGVVTKNSSQHTLEQLELRAVLEDCQTEKRQRCVTVGEAEATDYSRNVPPKQARGFKPKTLSCGPEVENSPLRQERHSLTYGRF